MGKNTAPITEGEIYTVVETVTWPFSLNNPFYALAERSKDHIYWVGLFAPLSDIDEVEIAANREKELQTA